MRARTIRALRTMVTALAAFAVLLAGMAALSLSASADQPSHCQTMSTPQLTVAADGGLDAVWTADPPIEHRIVDVTVCGHCGCTANCFQLIELPAADDAFAVPLVASMRLNNTGFLTDHSPSPPRRPPRAQLG